MPSGVIGPGLVVRRLGGGVELEDGGGMGGGVTPTAHSHIEPGPRTMRPDAFDETVDAAPSVFDKAAEPAPEEDEGDGDADEDGPSPEVRHCSDGRVGFAPQQVDFLRLHLLLSAFAFFSFILTPRCLVRTPNLTSV